MNKKLMYINQDNQLLNPNSFKRLNQNKNLSKSQLKLLGLKKVLINPDNFRQFINRRLKK